MSMSIFSVPAFFSDANRELKKFFNLLWVNVAHRWLFMEMLIVSTVRFMDPVTAERVFVMLHCNDVMHYCISHHFLLATRMHTRVNATLLTVKSCCSQMHIKSETTFHLRQFTHMTIYLYDNTCIKSSSFF